MSYFSKIKRGISTTAKGMSLTFKHILSSRNSRGNGNIQDDSYFNIQDGRVTLQYPHETLEVPDHGRYQLDCEIDDCIVCDKCAKICPVNCIDIEAIKSSELIRTTSDGSPVRLYAAKFDIDLAKCCFCGLCTTVCPTECLTMNSEYDYSVIDITDLNFAFSNLSEAEAQEKRDLYEQFVAEKELLKQSKAAITETKSDAPKPAFRPSFVPKKIETKIETEAEKVFTDEKPKPVFKPSFKPKTEETSIESKQKPSFVPKIKPNQATTEEAISKVSNEEKSEVDNPKPSFKPSLKPKADSGLESKPAFKPSLRPVSNIPKPEISDEVVPKPKFVPKLKPKN